MELEPGILEVLDKEVKELIFDPVRESLNLLYKKANSDTHVIKEAEIVENEGQQHLTKALVLFVEAEEGEFDEEVLSHVDLALQRMMNDNPTIVP